VPAARQGRRRSIVPRWFPPCGNILPKPPVSDFSETMVLPEHPAPRRGSQAKNAGPRREVPDAAPRPSRHRMPRLDKHPAIHKLGLEPGRRREDVPLHPDHLCTAHVVLVVIDEEALLGREPVPLAEREVDEWVGLHELLPGRDHPAVHRMKRRDPILLVPPAHAGVRKQVTAIARLVETNDELVRPRDHALEAVPAGEALVQRGPEALGKVRAGHALHGCLGDDPRVQQRPGRAGEECGVEQCGILVVLCVGARIPRAVKAQKHLAHVEDEVSERRFGGALHEHAPFARRDGRASPSGPTDRGPWASRCHRSRALRARGTSCQRRPGRHTRRTTRRRGCQSPRGHGPCPSCSRPSTAWACHRRRGRRLRAPWRAS